MTLREFGDPAAYVVALIKAAYPSAQVTSDPRQENGWSAVRRGVQFVFVQVVGSRTTSFLLQKDVQVEVISFVHRDDTSVGSDVLFAQGIERAIYLAGRYQTSFAGGHARWPRALVGPYHQAILGLPAEITRFSGTYSLGYRSRKP